MSFLLRSKKVYPYETGFFSTLTKRGRDKKRSRSLFSHAGSTQANERWCRNRSR